MKRRGGREVLVALTAIVVSFYALVAPASAAQDPVAAAAPSGPSVVLRRVDSTDPTKTAVVFQYDGDAKDVSSLELTENAKAVTPTTAAAPTSDVGLVIVLDDSASTDKTAVLDQAKTAAKALVASLPATTKVAV
ncbi:MAG: hypothetical protein QOH64_262, partial [Acidimicrobiaceae bacterium]